MRAFLKFVELAGFCFGFAMVPVYICAEVFVMRNAEAQKFILAYGYGMALIPMFVCIAAAKLRTRYETTPVPFRDSAVLGFLGSCGVVGGSFIYTVPQPTPISGLAFSVILVLSLFALALSAAFYLKAERSWQNRGLDEQSGP